MDAGAATFVASLTVAAPPHAPALSSVTGRYTVANEVIVTATAIPTPSARRHERMGRGRIAG